MNNLSIFLSFIGLLFISCSASKDLKRAQSENEVLKIKIDSLSSQIALQELKLTAFEDTKIQLRKTEQTLIQFYQKYEGSNPTQVQENFPQSSSNSGMNYKDLVLQNEALKNQISQLNVRIDSFKNNSIPLKSRNSKSEQAKLLSTQQQKTSSLQKENTELKNNFQNLLEKNEKLDREQKQLLDEFKKTIQSLDQANNKLTEQNALIQSLQQNLSHIPKIDESALNEAKVENEQLKTQNNLLIQKLEYLNRLLADKNAEQTDIANTENLKNQIKSYETELDDRAQVIKSLNGFIDSKNSELQSLNDSLESNRGRIQNYQQQLNLLEKQNKLLENNRLKNESKINSDADTQNQIEQLNKDIKLKQEIIQSLSVEIERANQDAIQLKRDLDIKVNELAVVHRSLETSKIKESESATYQVIRDSLILIQKQKSDLHLELKRIRYEADSLLEMKNSQFQKNAFLQKQLASSEREIGQLQTQLKVSQQTQSQAQNISLADPAVITKLNNKCKEILNSHSGQKSTAIMKNGSLYIYLPHHILFTQDSYVMTPEGSDLLNKLAVILKNEPGMEIEISGYTKKSDAAALSVDLMIRNASTVFKLLTALGLQANKLKLAAKYLGDDMKSTISNKGIELKVHAL